MDAKPGSPAAVAAATGDPCLDELAWLCSGPKREGRLQQALWQIQFGWWKTKEALRAALQVVPARLRR